MPRMEGLQIKHLKPHIENETYPEELSDDEFEREPCKEDIQPIQMWINHSFCPDSHKLTQ